MTVKRALVIILDGLGAGYAPDARKYSDRGANTLKSIMEVSSKTAFPNLCRLGLNKIASFKNPSPEPEASYGLMQPAAPGKDTISGHWELAGLIPDFSFPVYPSGFPRNVLNKIEKQTGKPFIGNYASSGTVILDKLGKKHLETGCPIVYTSADSVFQVAAHEDIIPREELYEICLEARKVLKGPHCVARVIARPFRGDVSTGFKRNNAGRRDYSLRPPGETLLDILKDKGYISIGIGKIGDIFAHRGLSEEIKTRDNTDGVNKIIETLKKSEKEKGLIFANLVDFDMEYGHRRNVEGFARALEDFDCRIPEIKKALAPDDMLIISADHGCDPAYKSHTDHTRENVPLMVFSNQFKNPLNLGIRRTFADCACTIADFLEVKGIENGSSFKRMLI
ncbi:MAG: phosphopentomutase [Elusimicrobiota bacterium]